MTDLDYNFYKQIQCGKTFTGVNFFSDFFGINLDKELLWIGPDPGVTKRATISCNYKVQRVLVETNF